MASGLADGVGVGGGGCAMTKYGLVSVIGIAVAACGGTEYGNTCTIGSTGRFRVMWTVCSGAWDGPTTTVGRSSTGKVLAKICGGELDRALADALRFFLPPAAAPMVGWIDSPVGDGSRTSVRPGFVPALVRKAHVTRCRRLSSFK